MDHCHRKLHTIDADLVSDIRHITAQRRRVSFVRTGVGALTQAHAQISEIEARQAKGPKLALLKSVTIPSVAPRNAGVAPTSPPETPLRRDKRYVASEVPWLRRARFKYGADVQILDISASGIRVTHFDAIAIAAPVVFELSTTTGTIFVEGRVIHCREVELSGWLSYEIGCRFARTLPWFAQDHSGTADGELYDLLQTPTEEPRRTPLRREPLWIEYMIASHCELAAGVWLAVSLVLVMADWAAKLSK